MLRLFLHHTGMIEEVAAKECGGLASLRAAISRGAVVVRTHPTSNVEMCLGIRLLLLLLPRLLLGYS